MLSKLPKVLPRHFRGIIASAIKPRATYEGEPTNKDQYYELTEQDYNEISPRFTPIMKNVPLRYMHKENDNIGKIHKSWRTKKGKWAIEFETDKTPRGVWASEQIINGAEIGLSMGHLPVSKIPLEVSLCLIPARGDECKIQDYWDLNLQKYVPLGVESAINASDNITPIYIAKFQLVEEQSNIDPEFEEYSEMSVNAAESTVVPPASSTTSPSSSSSLTTNPTGATSTTTTKADSTLPVAPASSDPKFNYSEKDPLTSVEKLNKDLLTTNRPLELKEKEALSEFIQKITVGLVEAEKNRMSDDERKELAELKQQNAAMKAEQAAKQAAEEATKAAEKADELARHRQYVVQRMVENCNPADIKALADIDKTVSEMSEIELVTRVKVYAEVEAKRGPQTNTNSAVHASGSSNILENSILKKYYSKTSDSAAIKPPQPRETSTLSNNKEKSVEAGGNGATAMDIDNSQQPYQFKILPQPPASESESERYRKAAMHAGEQAVNACLASINGPSTISNPKGDLILTEEVAVFAANGSSLKAFKTIRNSGAVDDLIAKIKTKNRPTVRIPRGQWCNFDMDRANVPLQGQKQYAAISILAFGSDAHNIDVKQFLPSDRVREAAFKGAATDLDGKKYASYWSDGDSGNRSNRDESVDGFNHDEGMTGDMDFDENIEREKSQRNREFKAPFGQRMRENGTEYTNPGLSRFTYGLYDHHRAHLTTGPMVTV